MSGWVGWGVKTGRVTVFWRDLWTQSHGLGVAVACRRWQYEVTVGFGSGLSFKRGSR